MQFDKLPELEKIPLQDKVSKEETDYTGRRQKGSEGYGRLICPALPKQKYSINCAKEGSYNYYRQN